MTDTALENLIKAAKKIARHEQAYRQCARPERWPVMMPVGELFELSAAIAAVEAAPAAVSVLEKVTPRKHYFNPKADDHDTCVQCGKNFRNTDYHCVVGERAETDQEYIARLKAVLVTFPASVEVEREIIAFANKSAPHNHVQRGGDDVLRTYYAGFDLSALAAHLSAALCHPQAPASGAEIYAQIFDDRAAKIDAEIRTGDMDADAGQALIAIEKANASAIRAISPSQPTSREVCTESLARALAANSHRHRWGFPMDDAAKRSLARWIEMRWQAYEADAKFLMEHLFPSQPASRDFGLLRERLLSEGSVKFSCDTSEKYRNCEDSEDGAVVPISVALRDEIAAVLSDLMQS